MTAVYENSGGSEFNASGRTSHTFSYTVGSGSNRVLFVGVGSYNATGGNKVSGVTYNGVAMTLVDTAEAQSNTFISLWRLDNPASGANNVVVTFSTSQTYGWCVAGSYEDAGTPDASAKQDRDTDTTTEVTVTTVTDNSILVGIMFDNSSGQTATANSIERIQVGRSALFESSTAKATAGAFLITSTNASTASCGIFAALPPAGGGGVQNSAFLQVLQHDSTTYST